MTKELKTQDAQNLINECKTTNDWFSYFYPELTRGYRKMLKLCNEIKENV